MNGPDTYDIDDKLMDELGGVMDEVDSRPMKPAVTITVSVPHGEGCQCQECQAGQHQEPDGDEAQPTPEELDEILKANA